MPAFWLQKGKVPAADFRKLERGMGSSVLGSWWRSPLVSGWMLDSGAILGRCGAFHWLLGTSSVESLSTV